MPDPTPAEAAAEAFLNAELAAYGHEYSPYFAATLAAAFAAHAAPLRERIAALEAALRAHGECDAVYSCPRCGGLRGRPIQGSPPEHGPYIDPRCPECGEPVALTWSAPAEACGACGGHEYADKRCALGHCAHIVSLHPCPPCPGCGADS